MEIRLVKKKKAWRVVEDPAQKNINLTLPVIFS